MARRFREIVAGIESDLGGDLSEALVSMKADLDTARQEVLYARAETQNVRRRLEKDVADTRAYAATEASITAFGSWPCGLR